MAGKRSRIGGAVGDTLPMSSASIGEQTRHTRNKQVRSMVYKSLKHKKKKQKGLDKRKRRKEVQKAEDLGLEPPPKKIPKTIENTRLVDETMISGNDEEVAAEEETDEFAAHFQRQRPPKVLITTSYKPSRNMFTFLSEVLETLPCAEFYKRGGYSVKKVVEFACKREYTDVLIFNEDRKVVNGVYIVHLPHGPTAYFRLSNLVLGRDIKNHGRATSHAPELILNNFGTRLGRRIGRMFASLFTQDPQFKGRRVVTFHNQRDFIFFRHHRYIFEEGKQRDDAHSPVKSRLQELGPRFTLKLQSLQKGLFNTSSGEFEWVHRRKTTDVHRRRFNL